MSNNPQSVHPVRRRLPTAQRQQEIIIAAATLLGSRPLEHVSVDEIAERAGTSRALVYHYFSSKADLVRAVVEHESLALRATISGQGLSSAVAAYLDYVETHPHGYRLLHDGALSGDVEIRAMIRESRRLMERLVLDHFGINEPDREMRWVVRGWTGFTVAICLDWIDVQCADRATIEALLIRSVEQLVAARVP